MPDRRHRKPDAWALVFRGLTLLVYPLLIVFLFIFFGVASQDHSQSLAAQMGWQTPGSNARNPVDLYTFLPILTAGALIGAVGLFLSRKRARRRFDYNYQTQLALVVLSVGGLIVFFILRS